jgi:peptidoglycan/xylan/chitin deacetylase (PgdA/CDA1 family)
MPRFYRHLALLSAVAALSTLAACAMEVEGHDDPLTNDREDSMLTAGVSSAFTQNLQPNEVVITIDEVPHTPYSDDVARYLAAEGISAVFFVVGNRVGTVNGSGQITSLHPQRLRSIVENGHLLGNHSYDHPVANPSFCQLTNTQQLQQIVFTHTLMDTALKQLNPAYVGNMRRWFRSPGNNWNSGCSALPQTLQGHLGGFRGNVSWSVPTPGQRNEDIFCSTRDHATQYARCMDPYMSDLRAAGKGTVLFHGNLALTKAMIENFVARARAEGFRFVHPDCLMGPCSRPQPAGSAYGRIECPNGYHLQTINGGGGRLCINPQTNDAWGPFTRGMVQKCKSWGGGGACDTDRWSRNLAVTAYGQGSCPEGASLDGTTGYCVEGSDAFGPFPRRMIDTCIQKQGGTHACNSARWNLGFMRWIYGIANP